MSGSSRSGTSAARGHERRRSLTWCALPAHESPIRDDPLAAAMAGATAAASARDAERYGTTAGIECSSVSSAPATDRSGN